MIPSYPKIWNIGHRAIEGIFLDGPVLVQEKVDGSQISFGVIDGDLHVRSKGAVLSPNPEHADSMFRLAVEQLNNVRDSLPTNVIFRGEYLSKPKHNTLAYDRVPNHNIVVFDAQFLEGARHNDGWIGGLQGLEDLPFEVVPTFAKVEVRSIDELFAFLERESFLGGPKIEGIVVKRYDKWTNLGHPMFGKYVSEEFKESHKADWKGRNPGTADVVTNLIAQYKTDARWEKAIQHLRERGELDDSPRDIGALIKEVQTDVLAECQDEIREQLFGHFWKKGIARGITAGLPEWYKQRLAAGAFSEASSEAA